MACPLYRGFLTRGLTVVESWFYCRNEYIKYIRKNDFIWEKNM